MSKSKSKYAGRIEFMDDSYMRRPSSFDCQQNNQKDMLKRLESATSIKDYYDKENGVYSFSHYVEEYIKRLRKETMSLEHKNLKLDTIQEIFIGKILKLSQDIN